MTRLYEFLLKIISLLIGLDRSVILRAFEVNIASDIDYYDTKAGVVWLVNLPKHPLGERLNSTLQTNIEADIHHAPYCELKKRFLERRRWRRMGQGWGMHAPSMGLIQSPPPLNLNLNLNFNLWRRGCRGRGNRAQICAFRQSCCPKPPLVGLLLARSPGNARMSSGFTSKTSGC